jgi:hypothetical protein
MSNFMKIRGISEEVLHRVKEDRNILHTIKRRKANWIGHILHRNRLLKHITEGTIEGLGGLGSRHTQLLDDVKEKTLEFYGLSTRWYSVEMQVWKRLWTCCKTEYVIMT